MTDTLKLKQILLEKGITIRKLAVLTGIKVQTLSNKINNVTEFTQSELLDPQNAEKRRFLRVTEENPFPKNGVL